MCAETIKSAAKKCKHCGSILDPTVQAALTASQQTAIQQAPMQQAPMVVQIMPRKDAGVAIILGLFLGGFGAHSFYLGKNGSGVFYIIATVLGWASAGIGIGFVILLIEFFIWIVDMVSIPSEVRLMNASASKGLALVNAPASVEAASPRKISSQEELEYDLQDSRLSDHKRLEMTMQLAELQERAGHTSQAAKSYAEAIKIGQQINYFVRPLDVIVKAKFKYKALTNRDWK